MGRNWKIDHKVKKLFLTVAALGTLFLCACSTAHSFEEPESVTNPFSDYVYQDDLPQYFTSSKMAVSENGYYYIYSNILYFYDIASEVNSVVCSKAECSHSTSKCDAYVQKEPSGWGQMDENGNIISDGMEGFDKEKGINCGGHTIFYHDQHLYMIERTDDGDYLVRYDSRFNNKERISLLASDKSVVGVMDDKDMTGTVFLSGGYLYYFTIVADYAKLAEANYVTQISCWRVSIARGSLPEKLGAFESAIDTANLGGSCAKVCAIGDCVYFVTSLKARIFRKENPVQYRMAAYNTVTGEFSLLINKTADKPDNLLGEVTGFAKLYECCIDEMGAIYFSTSAEEFSGSCTLWKLSPDTLLSEKLITFAVENTDVENILYSGGKVYAYVRESDGITPHGKIYCLDPKEKQEIIMDVGTFRSGILLGVDERNLLISTNAGVYMVPVHKIGSEDCELKKISG